MEYLSERNRIYVVEDGIHVILPDTEGGMACDASMGIEQRAGANHTYVDDRLRGQGIASELVRRAVEEIERRGGQVKATCSYAQLWLARNRGCDTNHF